MKFILFILIITCLYVHNKLFGEDNCSRLLSDGYFKTNHTYQPAGCMLHTYTSSEIEACFKSYHNIDANRPIATFVGDSRVRQHFRGIQSLVYEKPYILKRIHTDIFYKDSDGLPNMEFRWRPNVDVGGFMAHWSDHYTHGPPHDTHGPPQYLVLSIALNLIVFQPTRDIAFQMYKETVTELAEMLSHLNDTTVVWMVQDPALRDDLTQELDRYNQFALQTLKHKDILFWKSGKKLALKYMNETDQTGFHLGSHALYWDSQMLLNLFCNRVTRPVDATCCKPPRGVDVKPVVYSMLLIASFFLCIILKQTHLQQLFCKKSVDMADGGHLHSVDCLPPTESVKHTQASPPSIGNQPNGKRLSTCRSLVLEYIWISVQFAAIMGFFRLCDRSDIFGAENKIYQSKEFYIPLLILLAVGIFTIKKSTNTEVLNRQQTDEWKGWMQLVILVYHYTGASQDLQIYMYIRVLVTSYLVMTGYGHVMYGMRHRKASAREVICRTCEVLFRLNFLSVCLCLVMNNSYQFYYFVPLVSVWFVCITCVVWGAIWITSYINKAGWTEEGLLPVCGVTLILSVISFLLITLLHRHPELFHFLCSLPGLKLLFAREDGSTAEWLFRWTTDRYSGLYGVAVGLGSAVVSQYCQDGTLGKTCTALTRSIIAIFSTAGLLVYLAVGDICSSKAQCNSLHPFSCIITILSYINLRNICDFNRSRHSQFFTWVGKISLELFVCQYHIWLAADTKGLLVLLPGHPTLNILLTTLIFVCVAHQINTITAKLTKLLFHSQTSSNDLVSPNSKDLSKCGN